MLKRAFFQHFCLTYTPPHPISLHCCICEKTRERRSEHLFKQPGKPSTPNVSPHQQQASRVSRCLPGCSCQDFSYQGPGFVSLSCQVKASDAAAADAYVWEQTRRSNKLWEAAGWWGRSGDKEHMLSKCSQTRVWIWTCSLFLRRIILKL